MTDVSKQMNRIPHESLDKNEVVSAWSLPSIGEKRKVVKSAKREAREKAAAKASETVEDVPRQQKPKPPTAEQLQQIADLAQQEGYADGFKEGMEKGLKQGESKGQQLGEQKAYTETRQKLDDEKRRISSIANQLMEPLQGQDEQLETLVVDMALHLAKHLIASEISCSPETLSNLVNRAIKTLPVGAKNITVYVNEQDAKLLDTVIPVEHRGWRLCDDNSLITGGCRVETADSLVDFSIESRLAEYMQSVDEVVSTEQPVSDVEPAPAQDNA
ncbi:flagellar assembly protein FliH [Teredinibacter haidensis]|uniref:flagellar assembly protein FliH n=1 Tax=Teredinibacter haidensis TaxID=2731755 RepID=UPI000948D96A|nr:flagellar assembly protein FliH [Teredinibacter haidensis]